MLDFPIVSKLGGRRAVFDHLRDSGIVRTRRALDQWFTRGRIPSPAQTALMVWAEQRGIAYGAGDFVAARCPEPGRATAAPEPHEAAA